MEIIEKNNLLLKLAQKDIEIARHIVKVAKLELEISILERNNKELTNIIKNK